MQRRKRLHSRKAYGLALSCGEVKVVTDAKGPEQRNIKYGGMQREGEVLSGDLMEAVRMLRIGFV